MLRVSVAVLFALPVCAQSLEEAANRVARKVAVTLRTAPPVAITVENRSFLPTPVERVRAILDRELNKGTPAGQAAPAVNAYISDSASGPMLVATSDCGESLCVSIERFRPEVAAPRARLAMRPVRKQAAAILDFAVTGGLLKVLEVNRLAIYKAEGDDWTAAGSIPFTPAAPMPRDPRGRLIVRDGAYEIRLPGSVCSGSTALTCKADESTWREGDLQVAFKPRRNVLTVPTGAQVEDFAHVQSECGTGRLTMAGNELQSPGATPLVLSGTGVALWSSETPAEATVVVLNPTTHEYEASRVAIDCDR